MTVDEPADKDQGRVLARWNDPARSPAIVERVVGDGRVLLWTTTADRAGNDWPIEPSFVLAVREAVRGRRGPTSMANTVTAGERMRRVVRSDQPVSNVRLNPPGGGEPRLADRDPVAEDPGDRAPAVAIEVPDTRQPGLYRVSWDEGPLGNQQDAYAANPDPRESSLERIAADDVKKLLDPLDVEIASARADGADAVLPDRPRDLARPGVRPVRPADRRVDLRHLGRTFPVTPRYSFQARRRVMNRLWQYLLGIERSPGRRARRRSPARVRGLAAGRRHLDLSSAIGDLLVGPALAALPLGRPRPLAAAGGPCSSACVG